MIRLGIPVLYMKKCLLCALALLLPAGIRAQDFVRIDHVGLGSGEFYGSALPTPVRIHIPAVPQAQTVELQFQFATHESDRKKSEKAPYIPLPHRILKEVQVLPGVPADIDLSLSLPWEANLVLQLIAVDASGRKIGEASRELGDQWRGGGNLVAVYCPDLKICDTVSTQIHRNIEALDKGARTARIIVPLQDPPQHWWEYGLADSVIVAGPTAQLSAAQRDALEKYARSGGALIILEKEIADVTFLAAYRQGPVPLSTINVGAGRLYRLKNLESNQLATRFAWGLAENLEGYKNTFGVQRSPNDHFMSRVGMSFTFPHLRWLIIWLSMFIIAVGPINFMVLRRVKRLELGWGTTCIISVLFASGLYFANSVRRPTDFTLDDTVIYSMDSHSSTAFAQYGFRVYSPERRSVTLLLNQDDVILQPDWNRTYGETAASIGSDMLGAHDGSIAGWEEHLGPPEQIDFPMLRWSFQDFRGTNYRNFAGTVHWTSAMHLKNDTGQSFREAIYLDYEANRKYVIPTIVPGQEIDLTRTRTEYITIPEAERKKLAEAYSQRPSELHDRAEIPPFSVAELAYSGERNGLLQVFIGWADAPTLNARLDVPFVQRPHGALVIVALGQQ
jgi:hypothetical protein